MSQVYHVKLKESVSETFSVSDHVKHKLSLTPILPEGEMRALLKQALLSDGYTEEPSGALSKESERGEVMSVDLEALEVTVSLSRSQEVKEEITASASYENDRGPGREAAEQRAAAQLAHKLETHKVKGEQTKQALTQDVIKALSDHREAQQAELNHVLQRVYAESLKRKASQLGDVMEVSESMVDGQYELTIKIER